LQLGLENAIDALATEARATATLDLCRDAILWYRRTEHLDSAAVEALIPREDECREGAPFHPTARGAY
jgi:hypothetical protein